eukprot:m.13850 g.13850  ORF g.13850 m.13850 type:complete len:60 (-) comp8244_c0_seq1:3-182(-)
MPSGSSHSEIVRTCFQRYRLVVQDTKSIVLAAMPDFPRKPQRKNGLGTNEATPRTTAIN